MKNFIKILFAIFIFSGYNAYAQPENDENKTLSPYFFVKSEDPEVDRLPLKSTSVQVNISGVIADVRVTQVYENEGNRALEALYIFPASIRAAVYGMKMKIGERTVEAEIAERQEARRQYEAAKAAGQSASLLEQQRPNVFQMNVANILPQDIIEVELRYTELLVPTNAVYEFVYPTVVGPRYSGQEADPSEQWVQNPYLHEGEPHSYRFDISANLSAGLPIQEISCPSHKVDIGYDGPALSTIELDHSEHDGGNRDFILRYRLSGGRIETGLLLFEGEKEKFFLLMMQPPARVVERQIPPREYIFIVDVSGSMNGFPLDISKKLLKDLIGNLGPEDRFNLLLFAGSSSVMAEQSLPANPKNIRYALSVIEKQRGGGGTRLLPALRKAMALPKAGGISRTIVIVTDGYVRVEAEVFDLIRNRLGEANLFAFGIGSSVNRHLIEGMARMGMGEPFVITRPEEAPGKAKSFRELIQSPVLTGIHVDFGEFEAYDVEPPGIPDVLAERPVIVFGKWRGKPEGRLVVKGSTGDRPFEKGLEVQGAPPLQANSALRYLWARHRISLLSDYNRLKPKDERILEVTDLGLTYHLMTAYTSFVAVDRQVRLVDGEPVKVKQPLPLPQGVSDLAVGGGVYARKQAPAAAPASMMRESSLEKEYKGASLERDAAPAEESAKKMTLELREVRVSGSLPQHAAKRIIQRELVNLSDLCMKKLSRRVFPEGRIVFEMIIGPDGRVKRVRLDQGKKVNPSLERCIKEGLKGIQFPGNGGNVVVWVTFGLI